MYIFDFQTSETLSILHKLESKLGYAPFEKDVRKLVYQFMADVRDCPGISVPGLAEVNKESTFTVSDKMLYTNISVSQFRLRYINVSDSFPLYVQCPKNHLDSCTITH